MTVTVKSLGDGQLGTSTGDMYTAPTATQSVIESIKVTNTHSSAITVNVYLTPASGTARRIAPKDLSLAAGYSMEVLDRAVTLSAGDKIQGAASTASKVDYVVSGVDTSGGISSNTTFISWLDTPDAHVAHKFVVGNAAGTACEYDAMSETDYFLDEDDMASDDASKVASQQSIKAYVTTHKNDVDAHGEVDVATDSGTASSDDLDITVAGGEGINTSGSGTTVTIAGEDATTSNKGIVMLDTTPADEETKAPTSKWAYDHAADVDAHGEVNTVGDSGSMLSTDLKFSIVGGEGITTSATTNAVTIAAELANATNKGVASFDAQHFTVSTGVVDLNIDDTPVNGETDEPITSNWAFDHNAATTGVHGVGSDHIAVAVGSQYNAVNRAGDNNLGSVFKVAGDDSRLQLWGGTSNRPARINLHGKSFTDYEGEIQLGVPDAAGTGNKWIILSGLTNNPELHPYVDAESDLGTTSKRWRNFSAVTWDAGAGNATITTSAQYGGLVNENTTDTASGARITLKHTSASAANNDQVGFFLFQAKNDAGANHEFGYMLVKAINIANTAEEGQYILNLHVAGAGNDALKLSGAGVLSVDLAGSGTPAQVDLFDGFDDAVVLRQGISEGQLGLLEKLKVVEKKDTGSGWFLNLQRMCYLLAGGVYQNRARIDEINSKLNLLIGGGKCPELLA